MDWKSSLIKEHCHRSFAVFSFICWWNFYLVPFLVPKMLKWTNGTYIKQMEAQRANHNEFLPISFKNGSRIWKNWLVFSNFNPFPSLLCLVIGSNKWFRCSDKVLSNKTASLFLGFHWCRNIFRRCKTTLKYRDSAPLSRGWYIMMGVCRYGNIYLWVFKLISHKWAQQMGDV